MTTGLSLCLGLYIMSRVTWIHTCLDDWSVVAPQVHRAAQCFLNCSGLVSAAASGQHDHVGAAVLRVVSCHPLKTCSLKLTEELKYVGRTPLKNRYRLVHTKLQFDRLLHYWWVLVLVMTMVFEYCLIFTIKQMGDVQSLSCAGRHASVQGDLAGDTTLCWETCRAYSALGIPSTLITIVEKHINCSTLDGLCKIKSIWA